MPAATEPNWYWRNPTPQGNDYVSVAYGNGVFVAGGNFGTITTSSDGVTWTNVASGTNSTILSVTFGNGRFIAKAGYGVLISTDGLTWTAPETTVPALWETIDLITFVHDRFYAMKRSASGAQIGRHLVATSTDGVTWTRHDGASEGMVGRIAYGGGSYVGQNILTGYPRRAADGVTWTNADASMMHSADGITWEAGGATGIAIITGGPIFFNEQWVVNGRYLTEASGFQEFQEAFSVSNDGGETWTLHPLPEGGISAGTITLPSMAAFKGRLYYPGSDHAPIMSTADVVSTRADMPFQLIQFTDITSSPDRIVAVARLGRIASSANGSDWTMFGESKASGNLRSGAFGDGQWILAGDSGLATSPDGIAWSMIPGSSIYGAGSVAFGNGRFIAGRSSGRIGISTDGGTTWTDPGVTGVNGQMVFAQGRFVATQGLVSSTDGMTWTAPLPPPGGTGIWTRVFVVDDVFYALGSTDPDQEADYVIARSVDGLNWTTVASVPERLSCVGGKGDLLVASSYSGELWTSPDGLTWQKAEGAPLFLIGPPASILWVGDSLVTVTLTGRILTSIDGVTWTKDEFADAGTMLALAKGNGQVLAMGTNAIIWEIGAAHFTAQPQDQEVNSGDAMTFRVGATGKEPLSYQWLKVDPTPPSGLSSPSGPSSQAMTADATPIEGANGPTLTIATVRPADAGSYRVIVSNALGSAESAPAALVVIPSTEPPAITVQPESQHALLGSTVSFSVVATGDGLLYQWHKDGALLADATAAELTVTAVDTTHNGNYTVTIRNDYGTTTSDAATLITGEAPRLSRHPRDMQVTLSRPGTYGVAFSAYAYSSDYPVTYQWRRNGEDIAGATRNILDLAPVRPELEAAYDVVLTNVFGSTTSNAATLTVDIPVSFTTHPSNAYVVEGSSIELFAEATGYPAPSYQWFRDGTPIADATAPQLNLAAVSTNDDATLFHVVATNRNGSLASREVTVHVLAANEPPTLLATLPHVRLSLGDALEVPAIAFGPAPLTPSWTRDGETLTAQTTSSLLIENTTATDTGFYQVEFANHNGSTASNLILVYVRDPAGTHGLQGSQETSRRRLASGETITLTQHLSLDEPLSALSWFTIVPPGWTVEPLANAFTATAETVPTSGAGGLIEWRWGSLPAGSYDFAFQLTASSDFTGSTQIVSLLDGLTNDPPSAGALFSPAPIWLRAHKSIHDSDTDGDHTISLSELLRSIELYNVRFGSQRTGRYQLNPVSVDGFAIDMEWNPSQRYPVLVQSRHHSADTDQDSQISLSELLRVIELYNTRSNTTRTGAYQTDDASTDGFAPSFSDGAQ
ncbi:immunoglobulin domain-containing protein [Actomonas aquatica]|uniref:Immunoglobulin domain-containing protein n=1 Tax=Actomonas aquatica TaxID=2866162 RepID=A0ABZ1C3U4_9BACT|nr:immunoglobulin domain-containing protein [Opitutus sp. WL0086]WRQ85913.1 immunoglobulin domain-containing protein [Opitutus sp. WL0086]